MPFRLNEFRAKMQFVTNVEMPHMVYKACVATGTISNTAYLQRAVCEALSRDLDIPLQDLLDLLPEARTNSKVLRDSAPVDIRADRTGGRLRIGPGNTVEDVR